MRAVIVQSQRWRPVLEDDFLPRVPGNLLLDELVHLFHARSSPSRTRISRNLLAVDQIHGAGKQSVEVDCVDVYVRTLNVLGRRRALVLVLHPAHSRGEEGGGGRLGTFFFLLFFPFLLPAILLLDRDPRTGSSSGPSKSPNLQRPDRSNR